MEASLTELSQTLERLGYVVAPHKNHICVRLALGVSIRVYSSEGHFRFVPQFGPFGRTTGLLATSAGATGLAGAAVFALGLSPVAFLAAFVGLVALGHDACRFVLSEACMTRLQQLILDQERRESERLIPSGASNVLRDAPQPRRLEFSQSDPSSVA